MAKIVPYHLDIPDTDPAYSEGPFIACQIGLDHYRVECQYIGHKCPAMPTSSVWDWMQEGHWTVMGGKWHVFQTVDALNELVRAGKIALVGKAWDFVSEE